MRGLARDGARGTYRYEYVIGVDLRGSTKSTSVADVNLQNRQWPKKTFRGLSTHVYVVLQIAIFSLETRFETAFRKKFAPAAQQKLELGIYIYI